MSKYEHIREKAIQLRKEQQLTLDEIVERLQMKRTTVYYWIKDIPIPRTEKQSEAQRRRAEKNSKRYAEKREAAYAEGMEQAPELFSDPLFRDFVVLYLAEGTRRNRNEVEFVNSNPRMVRLAQVFIRKFTKRKVVYRLQYHIDQNPDELKDFWSSTLEIISDDIKIQRKSNSGKLSGRNWRSTHGVLTVSTSDTYFRAKLQAWMDYVENQW